MKSSTDLLDNPHLKAHERHYIHSACGEELIIRNPHDNRVSEVKLETEVEEAESSPTPLLLGIFLVSLLIFFFFI